MKFKNILVIFIIFFFIMKKDILFAENFCKILDITNINYDLIHCENNDLLFGFFEFSSKKSNFNFIQIKKYNIEVIKKYRKTFEKYLDNYCIKTQDIRIKNITNYDKMKKEFNTEVIITCNLKKKS